MSNIVAAKTTKTTIGDACAAYDSLLSVWTRSRAILGGQAQTKQYDKSVNVAENILLPFSPFMEYEQYAFYKAEAELPGLVAQYARVLVGGLLRKNPQWIMPDAVPAEAKEWLETQMGGAGRPMVSVLDEALWEEMNTSRAVLVVDYPRVDPIQYDRMTQEQRQKLSPYVVVHRAENMINWRVAADETGAIVPMRVVFRMFSEKYSTPDAIHPDLVDTCYDYFMQNGVAYIRKWTRETNDSAELTSGVPAPSKIQQANWIPEEAVEIMKNGKPLDFLPVFPLNGSWTVSEPALQVLVDREIGLYNKISRRNHLLYGAATYTPYVAGDINDEQFKAIVRGGLGQWIHVGRGDSVGVLETPTDALADMEKAITATIEEMARMGIRMLSPEGSSGESGVSLEIRNAAQTAQLGLLNVKVSQTLQNVLALMLEWKYDIELDATKLDFTLSQDFNPTPIGADWMRLVTEWYQGGLIPRSVFLAIAKQNDVLPSDYDDEMAVNEIQSDPLIDLTPTVIDVGSGGKPPAASVKSPPGSGRKENK